MGAKYDKCITFRALRSSLTRCCRGVRWKPSVTKRESNALLQTSRLKKRLVKGTYKPAPMQSITVTKPKPRDIRAARLQDRQVQKSITINALYDDITSGYIRDSHACQRGKGTGDALDRMTTHLDRYYRDQHQKAERAAGATIMPYRAKGWVGYIDIHDFFGSTSRAVAMQAVAQREDDVEIIHQVEMELDSSGVKGTALGSEINQLVQNSVLDDLDHLIKEKARMRYYDRYMDDLIFIHEDKSYVQSVMKAACRHLRDMGLQINSKSRIYPLSQGIKYLHWLLIITDTGKVIRKVEKQKLRDERRLLAQLKKMVDSGSRSMDDVRSHYMAWRAGIELGNTRQQVRSMNLYYQSVFGEKAPMPKKPKKTIKPPGYTHRSRSGRKHRGGKQYGEDKACNHDQGRGQAGACESHDPCTEPRSRSESAGSRSAGGQC